MTMTRSTNENGRHVVDATLTLRLTRHDRELLQALVALQAAEMADTGVEVTAASYVRGLIRHEARTRGLFDTAPASTAAPAPAPAPAPVPAPAPAPARAPATTSAHRRPARRGA